MPRKSQPAGTEVNLAREGIPTQVEGEIVIRLSGAEPRVYPVSDGRVTVPDAELADFVQQITLADEERDRLLALLAERQAAAAAETGASAPEADTSQEA